MLLTARPVRAQGEKRKHLESGRTALDLENREANISADEDRAKWKPSFFVPERRIAL